MGFNRQDLNKREEICVCDIHNKFQLENGTWSDSGFEKEDFNNHIIHTRSQKAHIKQTMCDDCLDIGIETMMSCN